MLNKSMLIGRLGADPEVRYMPNGKAVTSIRLATSRHWTERDTGNKREETEWHRVIFFSKLADIAAEFLKKGSQAYVEGRIQTKKWQDKSGQDRYTTEIIADQLQMLGSKGEESGNKAKPQSKFDNESTMVDTFEPDIPF